MKELASSLSKVNHFLTLNNRMLLFICDLTEDEEEVTKKARKKKKRKKKEFEKKSRETKRV